MSTERLVRAALEDSVKTLTCPEPDLDQLLAAGRAARRRRMVSVAALAAAAVLVLVLAGLSFAWASGAGRALEPVPANPSPTSATTPPAIRSELQRWIDALPAGAPPATPYWHDGTLHVNGERIPAPYNAVDIEVAGDTVLVGGHEGDPKDGATPTTWALVRGNQLQPLPVSADTGDVGLSVDGRIAYWVTSVPGTKQFFTWDTETNTALASRTVSGRQVELLGIDESGNGYWQTDATQPIDPEITRWDVRANTVHPSDLTYGAQAPETFFDGLPPWMHPGDSYRSPDGTKRVFTNSGPSDSPSDCCTSQLRVRPVGPDNSVEPEDVITLALPKADSVTRILGEGDGYWVWWESNESLLFPVDGDLHTYLLRCSPTGGACQRVADLGTDTAPTDSSFKDWMRGWGFARAPVTQ
ncbi:hypothetical protein GCM10023168_05390 [Fodinibacter luteus]|uniref:WD40 repeat protein n=1 Tax=Fodinibacter luteus TaxID=552064 RepID=A0ABP8K0U8_9MICO